jgi:nitronate monooxygenase
VLTEAFSVGWPDAPHRVLRSAVEAAERFDGDVVGHVTRAGGRDDVRRFAVSTPSRDVEGDIAAMALYAGMAVGAVREVQPAGEVVAELVSGLQSGVA